MNIDDLSHADEWGPEKIVTVADARTGMRGVLVIDNTARGMGKGGTRMSQDVTATEIARLARVMTWKWAAVDLFFGGAKAGIRFNPDSPHKEAALRRFARALSGEVPEEYVFGLDMGLTECDAAIIQDELGDRRAAVGGPSALGGVPYHSWGITGYGVAEVAQTASECRQMPIAGARVVVRGFGTVGAATARRLNEMGAVVVAVSTSVGGLYDPNGLDIELLLAARSARGDYFVDDFDGVKHLEVAQELRLPTDILVLAAQVDDITSSIAGEIGATVVVERADGAITPDAVTMMAERNITVIPHFISNAGGAVAAACAMDARSSPFPAKSAQIRTAVAERLRASTIKVIETADKGNVSTHMAVRQLAEQRVHIAMELGRRIESSAHINMKI